MDHVNTKARVGHPAMFDDMTHRIPTTNLNDLINKYPQHDDKTKNRALEATAEDFQNTFRIYLRTDTGHDRPEDGFLQVCQVTNYITINCHPSDECEVYNVPHCLRN